MTYSRFHSDNWRSDVHVDRVARGYYIRVAASRLLFRPPPVLPLRWVAAPGRAFRLRYRLHRLSWRLNYWMARRIPHRPLRGPGEHWLAGTEHWPETAGQTASMLVAMQWLGLHVPQACIDLLRIEARRAEEWR